MGPTRQHQPPKKTGVARATIDARSRPGPSQFDMATWQRLAGNRAVTRLVQREGPPAPPQSPSKGAGETVPVGSSAMMTYGRVMKVSPYLSLHDSPRPDGAVLAHLAFRDRLFILAQVPGDWYLVETANGKRGFVWKKKVFVRPPDAEAQLHFVESNQSAIGVAQSYYQDHVKEEQDLRFYVNVLVHANGGDVDHNKGIYRAKPESDDWKAVQTRANYYIWIPSVSYAEGLRGVVSSGSRRETVSGWFEAAGDLITQFGVGVQEGVLAALNDLRRLGVDLMKLVALISADDIIMQVYDWVKRLRKEDVGTFFGHLADRFADFETKWNDPNEFRAVHFQGHVLGYLLLNYVLAMVTAGAVELAGAGVEAISAIRGTQTVLAEVAADEELTAAIKVAGEESPLAEAAVDEMVTEAILPDGKVLPPDSYSGGYYGTTEEPEFVLKDGFPARGKERRLLEHSEGHPDSAFRGSTNIVSDGAGRGAAYWADEGGYVYKIEGVPTWDVNRALQGRVRTPGGYRGNLMHGEGEYAIPSRIPRDKIVQWGKVVKDHAGRLKVETWHKAAP